MTAFYDNASSPLVNRAASEAVAFVNACRPAPGFSVDLAAVCLWSAQAVAPRLSAEQHAMLAEAALRRVLVVRAALRRTVAA